FLQPQHLPPNPSYDLFHRASFSLLLPFQLHSLFDQRLLPQPLPIHLPMSRQRQLLQPHDHARHHVARQPLPQSLPQLHSLNPSPRPPPPTPPPAPPLPFHPPSPGPPLAAPQLPLAAPPRSPLTPRDIPESSPDHPLGR